MGWERLAAVEASAHGALLDFAMVAAAVFVSGLELLLGVSHALGSLLGGLTALFIPWHLVLTVVLMAQTLLSAGETVKAKLRLSKQSCDRQS